MGRQYKNYRLKGSQVDFTDGPGRPLLLGNSVTESGFVPSASCITCHARAPVNADGTLRFPPRSSANRPRCRSFANDSLQPVLTYNGPPDPSWYFVDTGHGSIAPQPADRLHLGDPVQGQVQQEPSKPSASTVPRAGSRGTPRGFKTRRACLAIGRAVSSIPTDRELHRRMGPVRLQTWSRTPFTSGMLCRLTRLKHVEAVMIRSIGRLMTTLGLGIGLVLVGGAGAVRAELKVGDKAPAFELKGSDGKTYTLDQFKGKSAVVVAWFPKAFTGGCTKECKSLRANSKALHELDVAYFTASVDTPELNKQFAESLDLDYPILSDPDKSVAKAYGVLSGRGFSNRWTFYIDKDGIIKEIDKTVNPDKAGADVAAKVKSLGLSSK